MNKGTRAPFLALCQELTEECAPVLCELCRYAESSGSCGDSVIDCHHPLEYRLPVEDDALEPGDDCWAFRPAYSHADTVDMVGCWLRGEAADMTNCKEERRCSSTSGRCTAAVYIS